MLLERAKQNAVYNHTDELLLDSMHDIKSGNAHNKESSILIINIIYL